ncbi:MAG: HdeD family acid-resistance protein [Acetobacteraceae bacterium]|nr:HdeD family acid-resistance protein [Acetobacteraceae bacterium]
MSSCLARNWWAVELRGIAAIIFGIIALWVPGAVIISLALVFAAYLIVDGVFDIIAAVRAAASHERWGLLLFEGVLDIVMGVIAAVIPGAAVLAFVLITAAWAIVTGGLMTAAAFNLHATHGRWWLALGGIVSIIWGILLILAPMIGAVVLTWWLGAYAIVFGVTLLMLGFRLRNRHTAGPPTGFGGRVAGA